MQALIRLHSNLDALTDIEFDAFIRSQPREFLTKTIFQSLKGELSQLHSCNQAKHWLDLNVRPVNTELTEIIRRRRNSSTDTESSSNVASFLDVSDLITNVASFLDVSDLTSFELADKQCFFGVRALNCISNVTSEQFSQLLEFSDKNSCIHHLLRFNKIQRLSIDVDRILSRHFKPGRYDRFLYPLDTFVGFGEIWQLFDVASVQKLCIKQERFWRDARYEIDWVDELLQNLTSSCLLNLTELHFDFGGGLHFPRGWDFGNTSSLKYLSVSEAMDPGMVDQSLWFRQGLDLERALCGLEELSVSLTYSTRNMNVILHWPALNTLKRARLYVTPLAATNVYVMRHILSGIVKGACIQHIAIECSSVEHLQASVDSLANSLYLTDTHKKTLELELELTLNVGIYNDVIRLSGLLTALDIY